MKTCFKSITWILSVLLIALCCLDTALAQSVTLSPTALTFCVASTSSSAPPAQTIAVSPVGAQTISYSTGKNQPWINVTPAPSAIADTTANPYITVAIAPASLGAGATQTGSVQVQYGGGQLATATVTVQVGSSTCVPTTGATLTVSPSAINFTPTSAQTVTVTITGSGQISYTPNFGAYPPGWFTAPAAGTINITTGSTTIQVSNNTAGNVSYAGSLTFTQGTTTVTVPITFTGSAGNGTLVANPGSISQSFTSNAAQAVVVNVAVNTTGSQALGVVSTINAGNGPFGWISTPTSAATSAQPQGTSPTATFPVTISPANLTPGVTYSGSVVIAQDTNSGNSITVPISASVSGSISGFTASPGSLTFNIAGGTTATQSQTVTLSGPANASVSASAQISGTQQWLIVTPTSGTLSSTGALGLTISVIPSSLVSGLTYSGNILITQGSATVLTIPVQAAISGSSTLTITPSQLNFAFQIGQAAPSPQTISVSSPAGTTIAFTPIPTTSSCGTNWLVVSPSQATATTGTTPQPVTVSINTVGLSTPTTCSGNVQISAPSASNSSTNIPVSLLVSNNPLLQVSPSALTFNATPGAGIPQAQQIQLTSSSTALPYTMTVNPSSSGAPNFLTITQSAATTPATLTVNINAAVFASLAPGTYTDNLVLSSSGAGNPTVTIPITLTIANTAALTASPTSMVFNYQLGQNSPPIQNVIVSSTGAPVQYSAAVNATSCGSWLSVSPITGSTQNGLGQNGATLTVQALVNAITAPAVCTGTITLTTASSTVPVTINVTLNVVNTAAINVGSAAIVQTINATAPTPATIPVSLTSTDATFSSNGTMISYAATASTNPAGQTWLSVTPNTGATPSNLFVRLDPSNLAPGTYTGTITITSATAVPTQSIPVTLIIAAQATVSPASLTFAMNAGGANPANQTVTVGGVPATTTIAAQTSTVSCGSSWLNATVSGTTVTVSISGSGITTAGTCTGTVTVIVPGATNPTLSVPVTLNVAALPTLTVPNTTLTFNSTAGATTAPTAQTVQLTASGSAAVPFTVVVAAQGGATNFLTASPATGTTPATLTVGIDPTVLATLTAGTYNGTVTVSSTGAAAPLTINVTLTVAPAPAPSITSIVNAATQQPGALSPGELVTIYGTNLGPTPAASLQLTAAGTVPTTLGGVQVMFDQTAAPVIYASATQVNAIVPYEMAGRLQTTITLARGGMSSTGIQLRITDSAPGIFTANSSGSGQGAVLNQDYSFNGTTPAAKGSVIQIWATGEGALSPSVATGSVTGKTGPFPKPVTQPVSVTFQIPGPSGGTVAVPAVVQYAGEAPGLVSGVMQVNAVVPDTVPSGTQIVMLTVGNNSSPATVTVRVQ